MIFTDLRVPASGPKDAKLAAIGMSPQKWEVASGQPFSGSSGRVLNEALSFSKHNRQATFVTNICEFFIDDNNLYSVPQSIMEAERARVFAELDAVRPNCLLVMGADTLDFLTAKSITTKYNKKTGEAYLDTVGSKDGIVKWRGSIFELPLPSGRKQKCVAAMHPANFIRGQWKWLPLYKYIDVKRAVTQSTSPGMNIKERQAIVGRSFKEVCALLKEACNQEWVSVDYEGRKHISCLGFGWSDSWSVCIPMTRVGSSAFWTLPEEVEIWTLWSSLMENPRVKKICQNASFEWIKSWLYGIYPNPLGLDTMLAHHCLFPDWGGVDDEWLRRKRKIDNPGHGLALITSQYTDQPFYKDDGRHWRPELGEDAFWRYNCLDVMVTFEAAMAMKRELEHYGLWDAYVREYHDGFEKCLQMEWDGILWDVALRDDARHEAVGKIKDAQSKLQDLLGLKVIAKNEKKGAKPEKGVLNLSSPAQMRAFLTKRGYSIPLNRKTGEPTVDKDTMAALSIEYPDDISLGLIIETNKTQDYIDKVLDVKLDDNNHIHCHWKQGGTNGTRLSSTESILDSGTNLQNIPRVGTGRRLFLPS